MRHGDFYSFPMNMKNTEPMYIDMMGIDFCHPGYRLKRAHADITLLAYIVEGKGTFHVEDALYEAEAGDIVLLPHGSCHEYYPSRNCPLSFLWFNIGGDLITHLIWSYKLNGHILVKGCDVGYFFEYAIRLCRESEQSMSEIHQRLVSIVYNIVLSLASAVKERSLHYSSEVVRIKTFMDNSVEERICLEDLSAYMEMSSRQLNRIFKKETGKTPYSYFMDKKIELAKRYLANTNFKIKEISERLSFSDPYYFSNAFKEKVGMSPAEYKKQRRSC